MFAAAITPFAHGSPELSDFEENCRFQEAMGVDGLLVAGTTGENARLSCDQRRLLLEEARRHLGAEKLLISGVTPGAEPAAIVEESKPLAEAGADAILVAPNLPSTGARDESSILPFYAALVEGSSVPVLAYHAPVFKEQPLLMETVAALRDLPGLGGVKDSLGRADYVDAWLMQENPNFRVFIGNASLFAEHADRVFGGILAIASAYPAEYRAFIDALAAGASMAEASAELSSLSTPLQRFTEGRVPALKEMHEELGLFGGEST